MKHVTMSLQSERFDAEPPKTEFAQSYAQEMMEMSDTGTVHSTVTAFMRPLQAFVVQRRQIQVGPKFTCQFEAESSKIGRKF